MIRYDPTLVVPTSNFFVLCTNVNLYLYRVSKVKNRLKVFRENNSDYKSLINKFLNMHLYSLYT